MIPLRRARSVLATPGSNPRMIAKALASDADLVMLDLEDAVAPEQKAAARNEVARALREADWRGRPRLVRVNALGTPYFHRDLIDLVEQAGDRIDLVMLPKVERPAEVVAVDALLTGIEAARGIERPIGLEAQIETAAGLLAAPAIATASPRLEALVFGPGDYAASARMPLTAIGAPDEWDARYPGHRFGYAMHQIVVAARATGLRAIDGPYADVRDPDGLRRSALVARALGFDGKWCIHPSQIAIVNDVFSPDADEIAWARRVLEAADAARRDGRGALALDGRMIDAASLRMAEATLARADASRSAETPPSSSDPLSSS
jgi:citrate lyase beta subunit